MYTFIVNPNARSGLGFKLWSLVEAELEERNVRYQVYFTRYQRHAVKITRELTSDLKRHTIVVLGGDGTINETINGIASLPKVTLGYIPIGSSNDFARALHLPTDIKKALDNILRPSAYIFINIGVLSCGGKKRRFAVSSGMGFDAGICHDTATSRLKLLLNRIGLGKLTYVGIALRKMISLKPQTMTVTLDNSRRLTFDKVYFAAAMNLMFEGGGFRFCPNADYQDNLLDIIVIAGLSKLKILALLPTAYKGWHTRFRGVYTFSCRKIDLKSSAALPLHTDGEPILSQPEASIYLEQEKLRVISAS